MKFCPSCKTEKNESDFTINRKRYDGLNTYCRECSKKYARAYDLKNKKITGGKEKCHRCTIAFGGDQYGYKKHNIDGFDYCDSCVADMARLNKGVSNVLEAGCKLIYV